ncbi:MAG: putative bifunctional diguanylate cyclase/phosphodiesterase [Actinomycetota bacterium]
MSQRRRSTDAVEPEVAEPSGRRTPLIWLYELATILPLFVYLGYEIRTHPGEFLDGRFAGPLLLEWVVAIAVVDLLPIPTSIGFPFSLSFPLQLSVALIYPTPVAGAIALLGASDWREFRREIPAMQGLWNRSQLAWSVVFESLLFERLASLRPPSPWWQLGPAVLVAAIVGYSVNALLCAVYFHLRTGEGTFAILRDMHVGVFGEFVVSYMGLALFAVIVATTFLRIGPWSIAVFIAPLAFARQMFTRTQSLQVATNELAVKQRENEYQALHDALTDLPNRVLFQQKLRETIGARSESSGIVAVMLIDLDHFKEINDTLGHHFGDALLQEIGPRLGGTLRADDMMARLGGDEFGLVLPDLDDEASAIRVAERILEELERPIAVEALQLDVSGSIGIALYPTHSEDVETLLRRADVAMYAAKESGSGYEVYMPSLDRNSPGRLTLITQVRPAIENHEFALFYQPKVRLADEKVEGVEALIRWRHPERGLVMPDDFIPMVERTVLLKPLTLYAINEALRQSHHWERQGLPLDVAVNLSPRSLLDPQLPVLVAELLERWEVDPARLTLELTESFLMADSGRSIGVMGRLSSVGIQLSIDDFGTGYSSLSHLKRLPLREIKVDKSFVEHMREDPNDAMIVAATVELGRNLGLRVVAEGVEDRETLEELARMGCDMAQGFEFSEPLAATDLTRWVEERGGAAALAGGAPPSTAAAADHGRGHLQVV